MLHHAEESAFLAARGRATVTLLEAANSGAAAKATQRGAGCCELVCSSEGQQLWQDRLGSPAVALSGSRHFAAATLLDGTLQARL